MNEELYSLAGKLRTEYQKKINNTYIWSSLARDAILDASINAAFIEKEKEKIKVPTKNAGKTKIITRNKIDLISILNSAGEKEFNYSIHTYVVAQVEAFFFDLIKGVLKIDRRRLKTKVQGIDHVKKIDVDIILDSSSIDGIIDILINQELISVFYASPEKQLEYIQKVVGIQVDNRIAQLFTNWKEYKATRDLIVHNHGIVNEIYIEKAKGSARGSVGEVIPVSKDYVDLLIAETKSLIGRITTSIQRKNKLKEGDKNSE